MQDDEALKQHQKRLALRRAKRAASSPKPARAPGPEMQKRIITRDREGRENGWLIPLWNALERPDLRPEQVYLTVVKPGTVKGPHLHLKRRGLFCVVRGCATIVFRDLASVTYLERLIVPGDEAIHVSPGMACAIYNTGTDDAYVINMPSPAWSKEDPDDWPVENWKDPEWWKVEQITPSLVGAGI